MDEALENTDSSGKAALRCYDVGLNRVWHMARFPSNEALLKTREIIKLLR